MSIATHTGDSGYTSLRIGGRVKKTHPRVKAYGTIDELSASIGVARAHCTDLINTKKNEGDSAIISEKHSAILLEIQKHLHALSADLASIAPHPEFFSPEYLKFIDDTIISIESSIPKINHFIFSGDSIYSSYLHLARTICRRAERNILEVVDSGESLPPIYLQYINRLSDAIWLIAVQSDLSSNKV